MGDIPRGKDPRTDRLYGNQSGEADLEDVIEDPGG